MITAYQFEGIQASQEKLVAEQKFFMRCNRPYDNMMIDSQAVGMLEMARSKSKSKLANNPLHTQAPSDYKDNLEEEDDDDGAITTQKTDLTEIEMAGKPIIEEKEQPTTVALKVDGKEPNLNRKQLIGDIDDPLSIVKYKVTKIEDVNRYSYNVNFIDDALVLIGKKDIYPRVFKLRISAFLSKVVIVLAVAAIVTAFKVFLQIGNDSQICVDKVFVENCR